MKKKCVTVFGSGKITRGSSEYRVAYETGRLLAQSGFIHVSGGYGGTMVAGARGAKEAKGETIGVTIKNWGPPNPYTDTNYPAKDIYERLEKLLVLGEAYIALPGATGTIIELAMAWERALKGLSAPKPVVLIGDFWNPVINLIGSKLAESTGAQKSAPGCLYSDFIVSTVNPEEAINVIKRKLN